MAFLVQNKVSKLQQKSKQRPPHRTHLYCRPGTSWGRDEQSLEKYPHKCFALRVAVQVSAGEMQLGFAEFSKWWNMPSANKATCCDTAEFYWCSEGLLYRQLVIFFFFIKEHECPALIADGLGSDILKGGQKEGTLGIGWYFETGSMWVNWGSEEERVV